MNTKYGPLATDHVLFIAAGAFHMSKPSDLIPELQGRFPIRVELDSLTAADFETILTQPKNALMTQYTALLAADGVRLDIRPTAIAAIARIATEVNERDENIGARRLHTVLERVFEDIGFAAPEVARDGRHRRGLRDRTARRDRCQRRPFQLHSLTFQDRRNHPCPNAISRGEIISLIAGFPAAVAVTAAAASAADSAAATPTKEDPRIRQQVDEGRTVVQHLPLLHGCRDQGELPAPASSSRAAPSPTPKAKRLAARHPGERQDQPTKDVLLRARLSSERRSDRDGPRTLTAEGAP